MELRKFDFEHRIFQIDGAYFFRSRMDDKVLLHVSLGDQDAAIFTDTLVTEFGIKPDSKDSMLLGLVEKALNYVKFVAPGDEIPTEIIDGSASWAIDEAHYKRARDRLMVLLASWVTGQTVDDVDFAQMSKMMETEETQQHIQEGFSKAAESLGFGKAQREKVVGMIEQLARELGYIEALRDHFQRILRVERDLMVARTTLRGDKQSLESAMRASQLLMAPMKQYRDAFDTVDAQTAEVVAALKNIDSVISFVRNCRDQLHRESLIWSEILEQMEAASVDRRNDAAKVVQVLYRFAAQNYLETPSWL